MSDQVAETASATDAAAAPGLSRRERLAQLMSGQDPPTPPAVPEPTPSAGAEPAPDDAPAPETPPSEPAAADPVLDRSWSALDRRDRELLTREKQYKDQLKELEPLRAAAQAIQSGDRQAAAKQLGLDPKALAAEFWGDDRTDDEKQRAAEQDRLASFEQRLAERDQVIDELLNKQRKGETHTALKGAIAKSKDLELAQLMAEEMGGQFLDDIEAAVLTEKERFGEVPDLSDVLKRTEDTLTEQYTDSIRKLAQVPKMRQRIVDILKSAEAKGPKSAPPSSPPPARRQPRTISNDMGQEPTISNPRPTTKLERRARALSILEHGVPKGD